jgi:hypothetical protein
VANWQTRFFSIHKSRGDGGLWMKLSLPTVTNSPGKLANSILGYLFPGIALLIESAENRTSLHTTRAAAYIGLDDSHSRAGWKHVSGDTP